MLISDFKAKAIATLKKVQSTGQPVLVTLRGKPLAEVVRAHPAQKRGIHIGAGRGLIKKMPSRAALVRGDFPDDWEMSS